MTGILPVAIPSSLLRARDGIERSRCGLRRTHVDLALARIKNNLGQLRGPVQRSAHEALTRRIAGRVKLAHLRYYLGAALFAALVGIGVNALLLQRERHPAPLFGYAAPKVPSAAPAPAPPPPQKPTSTEDNAPPAQSSAALPPARPARERGEFVLSVRSDRRTVGRGTPRRCLALDPGRPNRPGQTWLPRQAGREGGVRNRASAAGV